MSVKEAATQLNTSPVDGLSRKAVRARARKIGKNTVFPIPTGSFTTYLKHVLCDFTSLLLLATVFLSLLFGQDVSADIILVLLLLHAGASVLVYLRAQKVLQEMGVRCLPNVRVIREGRLFIIKQDMLLPGDLICLSAGDVVPADCRLVESHDFAVCESAITEENKDVVKDADFIVYSEIPTENRSNMVFATTVVTAGNAKALVCDVAQDTVVCARGKIKPLVSQEKLKVIGVFRKYCSVWSLCLIGLIFLLCLTDLFLNFSDRGLFDLYLMVLTLAVASMSELYAAFGYIVIASGIFSAMRQTKTVNEGAMIKSSAKLDTLKDLNCLVLSKESLIVSRKCAVELIGYAGDIVSADSPSFAKATAQLQRYAVLSTGIYGAAAMLHHDDGKDRVYSAEEELILSMAKKSGVYSVALEQRYPLLAHRNADGVSRFETSLVFLGTNSLIVLRGEATEVIRHCRYCTENGKAYPLAGDRLTRLMNTVVRLSRDNLRILAIATRSTSNVNLDRIISSQTDLTFEGLIAIREPFIEDAALQIDKCRQAGIRTLLFCDSENESDINLALSLGMIKERSEILTGTDMTAQKDGIFRLNLSGYSMFCSLSQEQKLHVLDCLRRDGLKIGFVGQKQTDIELMKHADISYAGGTRFSGHKSMANSAVEITGDFSAPFRGCEALSMASDIILSEPSENGSGGLNAVVDSISSAKVIYLNLLRMARYLISSQVSRFLLVMVSVFMNSTLFRPVQILISGLIFDFLSVLSIAFERPGRTVLKEQTNPEACLRHPIPGNITAVILGISWAVFSAVLLFLPSDLAIFLGLSQVPTVLFYSYLISQFVVLAQTKKEASLFLGDLTVNTASLGEALICFGIIFLCQTTDFNKILSVSHLTLTSMAWCAAVPILLLAVGEITKAVLKKHPVVLPAETEEDSVETVLTQTKQQLRAGLRADKKRQKEEEKADKAYRRALKKQQKKAARHAGSEPEEADIIDRNGEPSAEIEDVSPFDSLPVAALPPTQESADFADDDRPVILGDDDDSSEHFYGDGIDTAALGDVAPATPWQGSDVGENDPSLPLMDEDSARQEAELLLSMFGNDGSLPGDTKQDDAAESSRTATKNDEN